MIRFARGETLAAFLDSPAWRDYVRGMDTDDVDLLPLKEVRRLLSISNVTLWKWAKQGKISLVKLSARKVYMRRGELKRFIHDREIGQIPEVASKMRA